METTMDIAPLRPGKQLTQAKRQVLMTKMMDCMIEGYSTTNALSKKLGVSRITIDKYKPFVEELIGKTKIDRNAIRALQIQRVYKLIESLTEDLDYMNEWLEFETKRPDSPDGSELIRTRTRRGSVKERAAIYDRIIKLSTHLALITGMNIETTVNIDRKSLVIIRPQTGEKPANEGYIDVDS